jgi:hypothetical protein
MDWEVVDTSDAVQSWHMSPYIICLVVLIGGVTLISGLCLCIIPIELQLECNNKLFFHWSLIHLKSNVCSHLICWCIIVTPPVELQLWVVTLCWCHHSIIYKLLALFTFFIWVVFKPNFAEVDLISRWFWLVHPQPSI